MPPEIIAVMTMFITLSPFFITMFLILSSFAKNNLQGILYLTGLMLTQCVGYLVRPLFGNIGIRPDIVLLETGQKYIQRNRACNLIEDPWFSMYSCPSFHAIFHAFTITYIFGNDLANLSGFNQMGLFISLLVIYVLDLIFRITNGCVTIVHWIIGTIFGIIFGWLWFLLINWGSDGKQTYNSYITDRKRCVVDRANLNCKMEVYKYEDDGTLVGKLSNAEIQELTPMQWKTAMANQAMDTLG